MSHVTLVSRKVVSWVPQSKNVHLRQCWELSGVCVRARACEWLSFYSAVSLLETMQRLVRSFFFYVVNVL